MKVTTVLLPSSLFSTSATPALPSLPCFHILCSSPSENPRRAASHITIGRPVKKLFVTQDLFDLDLYLVTWCTGHLAKLHTRDTGKFRFLQLLVFGIVTRGFEKGLEIREALSTRFHRSAVNNKGWRHAHEVGDFFVDEFMHQPPCGRKTLPNLSVGTRSRRCPETVKGAARVQQQ